MSGINDAGQALSVGDYADDYVTFEQQRQGGAAAAEATEEKTAEADAGDGDESETAGADTAAAEKKTEEKSEDGDEKEDAGEKHRKKGGWQRKIEKAEKENAELRERLAKIEGTLAGASAKDEPGDKSAKNAPKTAAQSYSGKPEPIAKDFDDYESFTKELARWEWNELKAQEAAEQRKETAAKTQREAAQKFLDRAKEVAKKYDDFEEAVNSDLEVSPAVYQAMIESEHGPEIGYHLAKNPAEAERISKLSPLAAAREIGKLEARFATTSTTTKTRVSSAPDPIKPVSARGGKAAVAQIDDPDIDFASFERRANKRFTR